MFPLLLAFAVAADRPTLHVQEALATAGWPSGALSNTIVELDTPLYRSSSIVFQDTSAGLGAQVLATPAFLSVGPRLSLAPIDVFDVNLKWARVWHFGNSFSTLPFDVVGGKLESQRSARGDEAVATTAWVATLEPTAKIKLGPVIAFDAWTIDRLHFERPEGVDSPYVYEPYRDLVLAWDDWSFEHQAALLWDVADGEEGPMFRPGLTLRDTWTKTSKDHRTNLGPIILARPGKGPAVPTLVGMAIWYLRDADRVGPIPYLAAQARWELRVPLRPQPPGE